MTTVARAVFGAVCVGALIGSASGEIRRWDTGEVISDVVPGPGVDLSGLDLRFADFWAGLDEVIDLTGADFSGADLRGSRFRHARLGAADFSNADLRGARFDNSPVPGASFAGARLSGALVESFDWSGVVLDDARIDGAWLWGNSAPFAMDPFDGEPVAPLTGAQVLASADFDAAGGGGVWLTGVDFSGMDLSGVEIADVMFERCDLTRTDFGGSRLVRCAFPRALMDGTSFAETEIVGCVFGGYPLASDGLTAEAADRNAEAFMQMRGVSFAGARVSAHFASFRELSDVPQLTYFEDVDFSGADLTGSGWDLPADLGIFDAETVTLTDADLSGLAVTTPEGYAALAAIAPPGSGIADAWSVPDGCEVGSECVGGGSAFVLDEPTFGLPELPIICSGGPDFNELLVVTPMLVAGDVARLETACTYRFGGSTLVNMVSLVMDAVSFLVEPGATLTAYGDVMSGVLDGRVRLEGTMSVSGLIWASGRGVAIEVETLVIGEGGRVVVQWFRSPAIEREPIRVGERVDFAGALALGWIPRGSRDEFASGALEGLFREAPPIGTEITVFELGDALSVGRFEHAQTWAMGTFEGGAAWDFSELYTRGVVKVVEGGGERVFEGCSGDVDRDGVVGLDDFSQLAVEFGNEGRTVRAREADLDRDGVVGLGDFTLLAAGFGCSAR